MFKLPVAFIFTGPPGAGKSTIYNTYHPHLPLIDIDKYAGSYQSKRRQRQHALTRALHQHKNFVFTTAAPTRAQKEWWYALAHQHKFHPIVVALTPPKLLAYARHKARGHHDRLSKGIDKWYSTYTAHSREYRIKHSDVLTAYHNALHGHGTFAPYRQWEDYQSPQESQLHP
jgi:hypothetical protein